MNFCGQCKRLFLCVWLLVALTRSGRAEIYLVTNTSDNGGIHTLRGAVAAANVSHDDNTIVLLKNYYLLAAQDYGDQLEISGKGNLTIIGQSTKTEAMKSRRSDRAPLTTIGSRYMTRFFYVHPGAKLTLKNLVLTGGGYYAEKSGALKNEGTLVLENCLVQGNEALFGAGIYNSGKLTMNQVTVTDNSCYGHPGDGGGIYNEGTLTANQCVLTRNYSGMGSYGG